MSLAVAGNAWTTLPCELRVQYRRSEARAGSSTAPDLERVLCRPFVEGCRVDRVLQ